MSNVFWRMKRQGEQLYPGNAITENITKYITTWKNRCYSDDIPDEVPTKLANSMRAPSYRAIAMAILKNDNNLYSLGFSQRENDLVRCIIEVNRKVEDDQLEML